MARTLAQPGRVTAPRDHTLARRLLAALARLVCGLSYEWRGCRPDATGQRLYFANHTSHLDTAAIWAALPPEQREVTRPIAAADYWAASGLRRWLAVDLLNAILLDRHAVSARRHPIDALAAALGTRYSAILFPEGTRGSGPEPAAFKCGVYHLARRRPDLELVPVYLHNVGRVLPKGASLPLPLRSRAIFGPPLRLGDGEPKAAFLARARAALLALRPC